jgi:hypothetical protein
MKKLCAVTLVILMYHSAMAETVPDKTQTTGSQNNIKTHQYQKTQDKISVSTREVRRRVGTYFDTNLNSNMPSFDSFVEVYVTARDEDVVVKDVIINRGHCGHGVFDSAPGFPQKMNFGDKITIVTWRCDPIEVKVITNASEYVFDISN